MKKIIPVLLFFSMMASPILVEAQSSGQVIKGVITDKQSKTPLPGVTVVIPVWNGRDLLIAVLTLPLAFPGVVIGFMIIMLGGRQGLVGSGWQSPPSKTKPPPVKPATALTNASPALDYDLRRRC